MKEIKVNVLHSKFNGDKELGVVAVSVLETALALLGKRSIMVKIEVNGPLVDGPPGAYDFIADLIKHNIIQRVADDEISEMDAIREIQSIYRSKGGTGDLGFILESSEFSMFILHNKANAGLLDPVHDLG